MSVLQTELIFRKSLTGSSDGGAMSLVPISATPQNNLFPNINDADRIAGGTRYKKWFIFNNAASDALAAPAVWFDSYTIASDDWIGVGFDSSDDDDNAQGNMTAFGATALVSLQSSAADTRVATIVGLDSGNSPVEEDVTLTGTSEVLSVGTFSVVYAVVLASTSGSLSVTVRQGLAGTTRGTIGISKKCCWLWVAPQSKGAGIHRLDLAAQTGYGYWERQTWAAAVSGVRPDGSNIAIEED